MVADELALDLTNQYVRPGQAILDPFCGSGRLLAASCALTGTRIGLDVNPLACLITRAKLARPDSRLLSEVASESRLAALHQHGASALGLAAHRKVEWFSPQAAQQLADIVSWVNSLRLNANEQIMVAAALSATVRDVSFARKTAWKLHRLSEADRITQAASAWDILSRRLDYCAKASATETVASDAEVYCADATSSENIRLLRGRVDVVLTSPPYGDSRTTVQYGAASELCLDVVSRLDGFETYATHGGRIDTLCLGGTAAEEQDDRLPLFWAGKRNSSEGRSAARFLTSLSKACANISEALRPGGRAVFVVGRRSTGGYRLRLDEFLCDEMGSRGFEIEVIRRRALKWKRAPQHINRFAKATSPEKRATGLLPTMKDEVIVGFRKADAEPAATLRNKAHAGEMPRPRTSICR